MLGGNLANGRGDYTELGNDDDDNKYDDLHDHVENNTSAISHSLFCGYIK